MDEDANDNVVHLPPRPPRLVEPKAACRPITTSGLLRLISDQAQYSDVQVLRRLALKLRRDLGAKEAARLLLVEYVEARNEARKK